MFMLHGYRRTMPLPPLPLLLLLLLERVTLCEGANYGQLTVSINGKPTQLFAVGQEWQRQFVNLAANKMALVGGGRVYLATNSAAPDSAGDGYYLPSLLGKRLGYTVDLSNVP